MPRHSPISRARRSNIECGNFETCRRRYVRDFQTNETLRTFSTLRSLDGGSRRWARHLPMKWVRRFRKLRALRGGSVRGARPVAQLFGRGVKKLKYQFVRSSPRHLPLQCVRRFLKPRGKGDGSLRLTRGMAPSDLQGGRLDPLVVLFSRRIHFKLAL